jgi:hypothetical protein
MTTIIDRTTFQDSSRRWHTVTWFWIQCVGCRATTAKVPDENMIAKDGWTQRARKIRAGCLLDDFCPACSVKPAP